MKLGIFGGTFNPIHYGHLRSAQEVSEDLGLERLIFIPSFIPPHKELAHDVPGGQRLETVRLAIQDNPLFELSAFEVEAGVTSYSIKTIEHVR
ncbi:MAG: adenylyltransferase/cytidyltransferase family protein, partial [Syntrophaceae bacterium]